jgi:HEAT repeat protein
MRKIFQEAIRAFIEKMPLEQQSLAHARIAAVVQAGGSSVDLLCSLVSNTHASTEVRATACWLIGQFKSKRCVHSLLDGLRAPERLLYWEAAKALGASKSARALRPLVEMLAEPHDTDRYAAIIYALGVLRDSRAIDSLVGVLTDRLADPQVRGFAAEALAHLPSDERIVDTLIMQLADSAAEVRYWCAFALGQQGALKALPALEQLAAQDTAMLVERGTVRQEALEAIEQIQSYHP